MRPDLLIPLCGIALPVVLVPMIMALKQSAKKREYEHKERMKALETGQPVPGEAAWPAALVCTSIGAGVPIGSFFFTFLASMNSPRMPEEIWVAPMAVSVFALMTSGVLAWKLFRSAAPPANPHPDLIGKPAFDPDAYDVVGSRG